MQQKKIDKKTIESHWIGKNKILNRNGNDKKRKVEKKKRKGYQKENS